MNAERGTMNCKAVAFSSSFIVPRSYFPFCHQFVLPPAFVDGGLRLAEQELRRVGVALLKHPVACLGVDVVLQGSLRLARIQLKRVLAFGGARRVETVKRPVARLDCELLLV